MNWLTITQLFKRYATGTPALNTLSLRTYRGVAEFWSITELTSLPSSLDGLLAYGRIVWLLIGVVTFITGYRGIPLLKAHRKRRKTKRGTTNLTKRHWFLTAVLSSIELVLDIEGEIAKVFYELWSNFCEILAERFLMIVPALWRRLYPLLPIDQ